MKMLIYTNDGRLIEMLEFRVSDYDYVEDTHTGEFELDWEDKHRLEDAINRVGQMENAGE